MLNDSNLLVFKYPKITLRFHNVEDPWYALKQYTVALKFPDIMDFVDTIKKSFNGDVGVCVVVKTSEFERERLIEFNYFIKKYCNDMQ